MVIHSTKYERDGRVSSDDNLRLASSRASSIGTFVNREMTSNDTKHSSWRMILDVMNDTNSDELLTNELELPINGARIFERYLESSYIGDKTKETMGLNGIYSHWVLMLSS